MSYRQIKFRGKDVFSGQWRYGAYIPTDFTQWREPSIFDGHHRAEVDGETLGQYTGYEDEDGKEIYEGDILETRGYSKPDFKTRMIVRYNAGFYVEFTKDRLNVMYKHDFLLWKDSKVIGNIHDNPELAGR